MGKGWSSQRLWMAVGDLSGLGVGFNPIPSFLPCTAGQAQSFHPHPSSLSSFPCPGPFPHLSGVISAPLTTSPTSSPSLFPPASPAP